MKKILCLALLFAFYGCTAIPTISNPTVTQTLTLSSSAYMIGTGTFTDITTNISTGFTLGNVIGSWNFQTGKHDTVEFSLSLNAPCTFSYYFSNGSSSSPTTVASGTAVTDANGNYTSSQITF